MQKQGNVHPWGRASIPFLQDHNRLSKSAIIVYMALQSFAGSDNVAYPSIPALCERSAYSEKTVRRAMTELKALGWIKSKRRYSQSNTYIICTSLNVEDAPNNDRTDEVDNDRSDVNTASVRPHDDRIQSGHQDDRTLRSTVDRSSPVTKMTERKRPGEKTKGKDQNLSSTSSPPRQSQPTFALEVQDPKPKLTDHQRVMKRLHTAFKEKTGVTPVIGKAEGANVKRLLKAHSVETIEKAIDFYFTGDLWFTRDGAFSLKGFIAHYNAIVSSMSKPAKNESKFKDYPNYDRNKAMVTELEALMHN